MKKLITLLFLVLGIISIRAEETTQLVILSKDGTKVSYLLRDFPQISLTGGDITVMSKGVSVTYSVSQTEKFYYEPVENKIESGIRDLQTEELTYRFNGNAIIFSALKADSQISMYSINGSLLFSKSNIAEGEYVLSLDNFSTGAYVMKVNEITCKIIKQ